MSAVLASGGRVGVVRNADETLGLLDAWGIPRARRLAMRASVAARGAAQGSGANRVQREVDRPHHGFAVCCQHRIPDGRRAVIGRAQLAEVELSLVDAA
jgi:hypothetical protein